MMRTHFYKFHGAGNDFIMIDNRPARQFSQAEVAAMCHRRFGVGADGLILLENGDSRSDFTMRYFNADGGEATLCGNGSRCVVAFANLLQLIDNQCVFKASDGYHNATILERNGNRWRVRISMNDVTTMKTYEDGVFLDTGSPHFVTTADDIDRLDVFGEGKRLRHDARFPNGTNVDFLAARGAGIFVRTYERGVEDETLSCGTGVTASALVWAAQHADDQHRTVIVETRGGNFEVRFEQRAERFQNICLTGDAAFTFSGDYE